MVDYRAAVAASGRPIGFFDARGLIGEIDRATIFDRALRMVAGLRDHGLQRGDRVVIVGATSPDYVCVTLACLLYGVATCAVASAFDPSDPDSAGVQHIRAAVEAVSPAATIVTDEWQLLAAPVGAATLTPAQIEAAEPAGPETLHAPEPSDIHHIQLTSGSTSAPKAALLTHRNVAAHLAVLAASTELDADRDQVFTWLPLYHDMGFIQLLVGLTSGVGLDLMTPLEFARDPSSWVRHMSERKTTLTAAPPFAYHLAASRARRRPDPSVDLSTLRQAYVGAEPIPPSVLRTFRQTFAPQGLADDVLLPCYGMAETVLATTLCLRTWPTTETSFGRVRWRSFDGREIVSSGTVVDGMAIEVTDETGAPVPDGDVGRIRVRGDAVMAGYLSEGSPAASEDGWHDTGDLGVLDDGELYIVGRTKEMLIVRGRNIPPYDIEAAIEGHEMVPGGSSVVFSLPVPDKGTEPLIAVVETKAEEAAWNEVGRDVAQQVRKSFGLALSQVIVLPRGIIPRTTSGKRQRAKVKQLYLAGELR